MRINYIRIALAIAVLILSGFKQNHTPITVNYPKLHLPCKLCFHDNSLWQVMRQNFSLSSAENDPEVKKHIRGFQNSRHSFYIAIERSKLYMHFILATTIENKLPAELALLPFVESHNDPFAHSAVGASGMWQMMPSVASTLKVKINHWQDDRRDIWYSTYAALTHLRNLNNRFQGNWEHAISAYNAGEGRIARTLKASKQTKAHIWNYNLSQETKQYLPKLLALQAIIKNPQKYGFNLPNIPNTPYFTPIKLQRNYAFTQMEEICAISADTLRLLNPGWRRQATFGEGTFKFIVPTSHAAKCEERLNRKNPIQTKNWQHHRVRKGDTISNLAQKYHTTLENIVTLNGLNDGLIKINQQLIIAKNIKTSIPVSHVNSKESIITGDKRPGPKQIIHKVSQGDSLENISRKYNISQEKIKLWNHITKENPLHINQALTIWLRAPRKTYIVKKGDSLHKIARLNHTTIDNLKRINHLKSDILKINQRILLKP